MVVVDAVVVVAVVVVSLETTFYVHLVGFSSYMKRTNLPINLLTDGTPYRDAKTHLTRATFDQ